MTANPTPAAAQDEAVDDPGLIATSADQVVALWEKLRAADQRAERMLCEACGTVTRDAECDCTRLDLADRQRLVNYADAMANSAAELEAQNAMYRAVTEAVKGPLAYAYNHVSSVTADKVKQEILPAIETILATTPAEALSVVRGVTAITETVRHQLVAEETDRLDAARRLFGPARE